jgi:hypothetical protein
VLRVLLRERRGSQLVLAGKLNGKRQTEKADDSCDPQRFSFAPALSLSAPSVAVGNRKHVSISRPPTGSIAPARNFPHQLIQVMTFPVGVEQITEWAFVSAVQERYERTRVLMQCVIAILGGP